MSLRRPGAFSGEAADSISESAASTATARRFEQPLRLMRIGLLLTAVTVAAAIIVTSVWGPVYGRYGWRVLAIVALWMEALLLGVVLEGLRPKNPYRHLEPRFSYLDLPAKNPKPDIDVSALWCVVPGLVASLVLLLTLVIG